MRKYVFFILCFMLLSSCSLLNNNKDQEKPLTYEDYQLHAANMIAQPMFYGDSILYKMTGTDADLEMFYIDTKKIYFSCLYTKLDDVLSKLAINTDSVEVELPVQEESDPEARAHFNMYARNFKIDTSKLIEVKYHSAVYRITIPQMVGFVTMKSNLRGGAFAITPDNKRMISHGVVVAVKGEPSLTDLTKQLTAKTNTAEQNAQQLLDFVTSEIEYSDAEATRGGETIKRPDEILFTRNSDCSGKTILYGSLLQQINAKWCILYYDRHVCIGVAGNFKPKNAAKITIDSTDYYIAEITAPGSIIGEYIWSDMKVEDLEFYQIPENGSAIIDYKTKKPLAFLQKTVSE